MRFWRVRDWPVVISVLAGPLLLAAVLLVILLTTAFSVSQLSTASQGLLEARGRLDAFGTFSRLVTQMEASARGFALVRDDVQLQSYIMSRDQALRELDVLRDVILLTIAAPEGPPLGLGPRGLDPVGGGRLPVAPLVTPVPGTELPKPGPGDAAVKPPVAGDPLAKPPLVPGAPKPGLPTPVVGAVKPAGTPPVPGTPGAAVAPFPVQIQRRPVAEYEPAAQVEALGRLRSLLLRWDSAVPGEMIRRVRANEDVSPVIRSQEGAAILDALRNEMRLFLEGEETGLDRRVDGVRDAEQIVLQVGVASVVLTILAMVGAGLIGRQLARPMRALAAAAGRIASGNLETRVPIRGANEIGQTGAAFNRMAESLQAARATLEQQYATLQRQSALLQEEMDRAAAVQADLLPDAPPAVAGLQVAGRCVAAREVGGDYYDWYLRPDGRLTIALADVMGKGMAAALLTATVRSALRSTTDAPPATAAVAYAERALAHDFDRAGSYATLFFAILDPVSGALDFVDAGHGHALLLRRNGAIEPLEPRSTPLGLAFGVVHAAGSTILATGDRLVIYSDGLLELDPAVTDYRTVGALLPIIGYAQAMVDRLTGLAPASTSLSDDLTVLAIERVVPEPQAQEVEVRLVDSQFAGEAAGRHLGQ